MHQSYQVYFSRPEAAQFIRAKGLPCTKATLEKLASIGGGPRYQKFGNRVVYTQLELDAWIDQKLSKPLSHAVRGK